MTKLFEAKPFIIAEVGSNWSSFNDCKDSISFAKQCGADAVKFQAFTAKDLYGYEASLEVGDDLMTLQDRSFPLEWLPKLKEKADACGIELMCSAFSPELYEAVDPYVKVHKIASSDNNYPQLLNKVRTLKKPVLISVGATSYNDVNLALHELTGVEVVLMYCSSAYPSREYNLFRMETLKRSFGVNVGFSDHSIDVYYPALSAFHHFGAVAIEKHVNFAGIQSPDSPHSLDAAQFKYMCDMLRGLRNYKDFNPEPEERDMFLRHNRRLVAIKDIAPGEQFKFGVNYGAYRSLENDIRGLNPFAWEDLEKRAGARRLIKAGECISMEDAH